MVDALQKSYPDLTPEQVKVIAGQQVDHLYGGLDTKMMGRSPMARDLLRLTLLAPDWAESNLRAMGDAVGQYGSKARFDLARITLYNMVAAKLINAGIDPKHDPHWEQPFGVVYGDRVYAVRTMPSDIAHMLTDGRGFINNRLNPLTARTPLEALTGRDVSTGKKRTLAEQATDFVQNFTPIPAQGMFKHVANQVVPGSFSEPQGGGDAVAKFAGLTSYQNTTPAEQLARKIASDHSPNGVVDPAAMSRHHAVLDLEEGLRSKQKTIADIDKAAMQGQISLADRKQIIQSGSKSRLAAAVTSFPVGDALSVWEAAGSDEKADPSFRSAIAKKLNTYMEHRAMNYTPAQRAQLDQRVLKARQEMVQPTSEPQ